MALVWLSGNHESPLACRGVEASQRSPREAGLFALVISLFLAVFALLQSPSHHYSSRTLRIRCDGQAECANCVAKGRACCYMPSRRGGPRNPPGRRNKGISLENPIDLTTGERRGPPRRATPSPMEAPAPSARSEAEGWWRRFRSRARRPCRENRTPADGGRMGEPALRTVWTRSRAAECRGALGRDRLHLRLHLHAGGQEPARRAVVREAESDPTLRQQRAPASGHRAHRRRAFG